jgi:hypothetical protein
MYLREEVAQASTTIRVRAAVLRFYSMHVKGEGR